MEATENPQLGILSRLRSFETTLRWPYLKEVANVWRLLEIPNLGFPVDCGRLKLP